MAKWDAGDAPRRRRCLGEYFMGRDEIDARRRWGHSEKKARKDTPITTINHTFKLHQKREENLSKILDDEREFFRVWTSSRHLEDQYYLLALTYWMRIRSEIATFFLIRDKRLYMVLCIHTALKWLGYDEVHKCNFLKDLNEISSISSQDHAELEMEVLRGLSWDL